MKKILVTLVMIMATLLPVLTKAQSGDNSKADAERSLDMARDMMKSFGGISDDFKSFKGDYKFDDNSGNKYYEAKGLNIGASQQYIAVKKSGTVVLIAMYKPKDSDDKDPVLAFTAFVGGIATLTSGKDFSTVNDKEATKESTLKYYMMVKEHKIASFSFDTKTKEGTYIVALM